MNLKIPKKKLILAIETSCDETSVAVVKDGNEVLSLETSSSILLHQETKGIIPEVASRAQYEFILPVLNKALKSSGVSIRDIDCIAVTNGPGLVGSLMIGVSMANILSVIYKKPLYGINHIHGHIFANFLERNINEIKFPSVVLTVSGGHNEIYLIKNNFLNFPYSFSLKLLGQTLDDSAGEAFDKCGRLLGLSYPAGYQISKLAECGNKDAFNFPRGMIHSGDFNFSFSGLKTSFLYMLKKHFSEYEIKFKDKILGFNLNEKTKQDLCASLQESICDILSQKIINASKKYNAKQIHLSGGVSANKRLRQIIKEKFSGEVIFPKKLVYCTDNAAMIGSACYFQNIKSNKNIEIKI